MTRPPAVAVMAKVPGATPVKSRLHAVLGAARATDLYRCFLLDRLDALAAQGGIARYVAFTPAAARPAMAALAPAGVELIAQEGAELGERLTRLFDTLLEAGHVAAIAMDSDSPTVPMRRAWEAAFALRRGDADVVVGPSEDGGYYLVGVGRARFKGLFDGVPFSTADTRAATLARARELGLRVVQLTTGFDVDTPEDVRRLRAELAAAAAPPRTAAFLRTLPS